MYPIKDTLTKKGFPHTPSPKKEDRRSKILRCSSLSAQDRRRIVESTGLTTEQWLPYHCKAVENLGPAQYLNLAEMARKGKNPHSLFSWLLKQEMGQ